MESRKCLNCGKDVVRVEGKREKKYCSDSCRTTHYNKTHAKKEDWEKQLDVLFNSPEVKERRMRFFDDLMNFGIAKWENLTVQPIHSETIEFTNNTENVPRETNDSIKNQIKSIEAEKVPPERNTPMGKKLWEIEKQKRISELKKLLKQ